MSNLIRSSSQQKRYCGLLAVNKPYGMVSKDVSRWLTKRLGRLSLGHVGTLDPLAEGVLPILFGAATKLQDHLLIFPKTYEFDCLFGEETDTLDTEGQVVLCLPWEHLTSESVKNAADSFLGASMQVPPLYSAVKFQGRALYDYARSGDELGIELSALQREVVIDRFEVLAFGGNTGTFRVRCSKGTYIRGIVRDLSKKLGTCGTMTRLVRTESAGFSIESALGLGEIEEKIGDFQSILLPIDEIDIGLPRWMGNHSELVDRLKYGQVLRLAYKDFFDQILGKYSLNKESLLARPDQHVVLVDLEGKVFGLGSVRFEHPHDVKLCMKRGLQ